MDVELVPQYFYKLKKGKATGIGIDGICAEHSESVSVNACGYPNMCRMLQVCDQFAVDFDVKFNSS